MAVEESKGYPERHLSMETVHRKLSFHGTHDENIKDLPQFRAVLSQLKVDGIAPLVSFIRQDLDENSQTSASGSQQIIDCKILGLPMNGSYNLVYVILFEDGVKWVMKIPANGHRGKFDFLAAEALVSEARTMTLIKQRTELPVPIVYHFDASLDNEIGCPYILMEHIDGIPLYQVWHDENCSVLKLESVRLRALQTVATAMVKLSQLTSSKGGMLHFDSEGNLGSVYAAKVANLHAQYER